MRAYDRIFGSGPLGLALSLVLLAAARVSEPHLPGPDSLAPGPVRTGALLVAGALGLAFASWSFRSLPPAARGRELCRTGAFRWVRHPLYAAFLSIFNLGLALFLDHWVYLVWALILHPLWHLLMAREEALMVEVFGDEYRQYARTTGRFVPRLPRRRGTRRSGISYDRYQHRVGRWLPRRRRAAGPPDERSG